MGFRDLKLFNLAMLGKQGWRLMTRPESLCARVLKGRYYHDSEFMECTRRKRSSTTWRAIMDGREALKTGLIRRIGDGSNTKVWGDRWIPQHLGGKPITPQEGHDITRADQLLTGSGQWNEDLVRASFFGIDAEAILRIPVRGLGEDLWAWEPEKHGIYSVKSAYKLLDTMRWRQENAERAGASEDDTWRRIGSWICHRKLKFFGGE